MQGHPDSLHHSHLPLIQSLRGAHRKILYSESLTYFILILRKLPGEVIILCPLNVFRATDILRHLTIMWIRDLRKSGLSHLVTHFYRADELCSVGGGLVWRTEWLPWLIRHVRQACLKCLAPWNCHPEALNMCFPILWSQNSWFSHVMY